MISEEQKPPYYDHFLLIHVPQNESWNGKEVKRGISWFKAALLIIFICIIFGVFLFKQLIVFTYVHDSIENEMNESFPGSFANSSNEVVQNTTKIVPSCQKRIVGYYTEFESIDITRNQINKLSHVVFAYIQLNWDGTLRFESEKSKERFMALRKKSRNVKPDQKLMIAIGGEENSQYFAAVTADTKKRRVFVKSITSFLDEYKIDGVDIYWKRARENDKWNYILLLRELRESMSTIKADLISITLPAPGIENWEAAYDLNQILEYVDFINVFSMDYYGPWPNQWGNPAGPIAPLYSGVGGRKNFNVDWTMKYYVCITKQPTKFNIVIPFFARLWRHVEGEAEEGKGAFRNVKLVDGKTEGSPYMSRWTVEDKKINLLNSTWDENSKSSYIYDKERETYLSFESERSLIAKKKYVDEMNLGGFWIWTVDMDNDRNRLLNALASNNSCSGKNTTEVHYNCL